MASTDQITARLMAFRLLSCPRPTTLSHFRPLRVPVERKLVIRQVIRTRSTPRVRAQKSTAGNEDREKYNEIRQVEEIDRAAAAFCASRAFTSETDLEEAESSASDTDIYTNSWEIDHFLQLEKALKELENPESKTSHLETPGPDFWTWTPQLDNITSNQSSNFVGEHKKSPYSIPFQSKLSGNIKPLLPPFQSSVDVEKLEALEASRETHSLEEHENVGMEFSVYANEASRALSSVGKESMEGIDSDGTRWWKETGVEKRPDGVICKWTLTKGVSARLDTEWQNTYWEAADEFDYKELGSEKSGRDSYGNVWLEYWKESLRQENGIMQLEKTANKWGKNGSCTKWQEAWWEYYSGNGEVEKSAHKWCTINPYTYVDPGHAHNWHEKWGEKYDGKGGSLKYTDKWAERHERGAWTKWGDKWDENFDSMGHGVKQGETWWEGPREEERWNRTWGEGHDGSGWVHKYGKSSSGEHWDTHVEQETQYDRFPHFGFYHCFNNSVQLRNVQKPSNSS